MIHEEKTPLPGMERGRGEGPRLNALIVAALCLTLTACGGLLSRKQTSRFFSLDRIEGATTAAVAGLPIGVDVVQLPPGFDRREIMVRKADQQLEIREREQWSASLQEMVLHTLAFNLASRLPQGMVLLPGQPIPARKRGIDVVFEELVAGPDNRLMLDARWTLRGAGEAAGASQHEQIQIDLPSLDGAAIAAGTSQAIAQLADRIAAKL